jgi:uncharacterized alpha-E superfamily protein
MLGRTANNLFWMARYMERAENIARLAEVGFRITLTPDASEGHREEWRSALASAGVLHQFEAKYPQISHEAALDFLLFDQDNPSSVHSCLKAARTNARSVRTKITRSMWETLNATWLAFEGINHSDISGTKLSEFLDWIRDQAMQFRGAFLGTVLRNDGYHFNQLGAFVERADNTARIVDVKYYLLLPSNQAVGGDVDTYQWETILRSVSAHRSYRHVYHQDYNPWHIADFLILRPEMPRSLRFCYDWVDRSLSGLAEIYGESHPSHAMSKATRQQLCDANMDEIFRTGLHEFLADFVAKNAALTAQISTDYNLARDR